MLQYSTTENAIIILKISEKTSPNLVNFTETKCSKTVISNHNLRLPFQNSQTTCILPKMKTLNIRLESPNLITALPQRRTKVLLQKVAIIFSDNRWWTHWNHYKTQRDNSLWLITLVKKKNLSFHISVVTISEMGSGNTQTEMVLNENKWFKWKMWQKRINTHVELHTDRKDSISFQQLKERKSKFVTEN